MIQRVGLVYDPIYLEHDTGSHVERADRLRAIMGLLEQERILEKLLLFKPRQATVEEIKLAHSAEHISRIENLAKLGGGWLDADTIISPRSYEVALYAAGGVLVAVDEVLRKEVNSAFALVRPPGHHAAYWQAMGFCLFNNIVIAAKYALTRHNLDRILIVDYDVHHGNGTQDAFFTVPHVLYFSTHQFPLYPGTGSLGEKGEKGGAGKIINVPLPPGCGDDEFERVFREILAPAARRFEPELILVSAGYDAHWKDTLASMRLTTTGFGRLARTLKRLADELCQGKIVFTLEGGYDLQALSASVRATLEVLLGNEIIPDPIGPPPGDVRPPDINGIIKAIRHAHGLVK